MKMIDREKVIKGLECCNAEGRLLSFVGGLEE